MLSIIVAADKNGAIGSKNKIPWRLKSDLIMLKQLTLGHTVILGRKTYESMTWYYNKSGRPMPGKTYIVVTRNQAYIPQHENVLVAHSVEDAVTMAQDIGDEMVLSIGGGAIFSETLPFADKVYLTEVQTAIEDADAYFPKLNPQQWREVSRESHLKDEQNEFDYDVVEYDRIA